MVKVVDHEQHAEARLVRLLRVVRDHINEFGVGPTTAESAASDLVCRLLLEKKTGTGQLA